jgi:hypothetical protein
LTAAGAETRAAVALLTRSIRIVSAGDAVGQAFPDPPSSGPGYFFGGHMIVNAVSGNYCLSAAEGVSFPISDFGMNQRMFSIYDGPAYQDSCLP